MANNPQLGYRIDPQIKEQFEAICTLNHIKPNKILEDLILKFIKERAPK